METLWQDLRYAARMLIKRPGFTIVVVLTLALGIGANTAIFSVINAVIFRPLPFKEPDCLAHLWEDRRGTRYKEGEQTDFITVRPGSFHDWKAQSSSFEGMVAYRWKQVMLTCGERAEMAWAHQASEGFFETLGARALLGRTFAPEEYGSNAQKVVILSQTLWSARFGADPEIIGQALSLDNASVTVIGVMPAGFYPTDLGSPQLWLPLWFNAEQQNDQVNWGLTTIARLKPGVTIEQAATEMDVIGERIEQAHPEHYKDMGAVLVPVQSQLTGGYGQLFYLLLGAVAPVLLVACANVANLLLARTAERQHEFAVRAALGASRLRLIRQLLCESLLLALTAGALGLLLGYASLRPIIALLPAEANVPRLNEIKLDWSVLLFAFSVSLFVGLLFGLAPVLRTAKTDLSQALKEGGRGSDQGASSRRLGNALVVSEVALSLILLVGAGLLTGSFLRVARTDSGFRPANLLTLHLRVPEFRYDNYEVGGKNSSRVKLFEQLEQRLSSLPNVEAVAVTSKLPMKHSVDPLVISHRGPRASAGYTEAKRRSSEQSTGFV